MSPIEGSALSLSKNAFKNYFKICKKVHDKNLVLNCLLLQQFWNNQKINLFAFKSVL